MENKTQSKRAKGGAAKIARIFEYFTVENTKDIMPIIDEVDTLSQGIAARSACVFIENLINFCEDKSSS